MLLVLLQMIPRGRVYRYPPGRNMQEAPMHGVAGGMLPSYEMGGMPMRDAGGHPQPPMSLSALATALANASPDQQRTVS